MSSRDLAERITHFLTGLGLPCAEGRAAECTRGSPYQCEPPPYGGSTNTVCYCHRSGESCGGNADCCSGSCINFVIVTTCL